MTTPIQFDHTRIKSLRAALGLTQVEFAQRLETTPQHVAMWESGRVQPTMMYLTRIVNVTGAKLESFFIPAKKVSSRRPP